MPPLFVCLLLLLGLSFATASSPPSCSVQRRVDSALALDSNSRLPTLLFFDREGVNLEMYPVWFGDASYLRCPVQCRITTDRSELQSAEAVLFWATPLNKGVDIADKCPGQMWLQSSTEAADLAILSRTPPGGVMESGEASPIDLEVSWRRGLGRDRVSWLNNFDWNMDFKAAMQDAGVQQPWLVPTKTVSGRDPGQAAVAAFISNCGATSPRLEMLRELQQHIAVDSFGQCAHNKDVPPHWTEEADLSRGLLTQKNKILAKRYKFLLAFENQETDDYVTEKFYHPLSVGVLPIVLGAPNIAEYAPNLPHSPSAFLNVRDFPSMAALAARIRELDLNDTLYARHFEWRASGELAPLFRDAVHYSWRDSPCQVCQALHSNLYAVEPVSLRPEDWDRRKRVHTPKQERREAKTRAKEDAEPTHAQQRKPQQSSAAEDRDL